MPSVFLPSDICCSLIQCLTRHAGLAVKLQQQVAVYLQPLPCSCLPPFSFQTVHSSRAKSTFRVRFLEMFIPIIPTYSLIAQGPVSVGKCFLLRLLEIKSPFGTTPYIIVNAVHQALVSVASLLASRLRARDLFYSTCPHQHLVLPFVHS